MFKKNNIPNFLTLIRVIFVPIIIVIMSILIFQSNYYILGKSDGFSIPLLLFVAGVLFIVASFTDFLDGYIARKYNYVSNFGKFFDPIADKLLVNSVLILFVPLQILPFWVTLILILRDTFVDFIRMILSSKQITLAAGIFGKLKTVFQMVGLSLLFFFGYWSRNTNIANGIVIEQVTLIPIYISVAFSLYSGIEYFVKAKANIF